VAKAFHTSLCRYPTLSEHDLADRISDHHLPVDHTRILIAYTLGGISVFAATFLSDLFWQKQERNELRGEMKGEACLPAGRGEG
jgi:hypothetical protein